MLSGLSFRPPICMTLPERCHSHILGDVNSQQTNGYTSPEKYQPPQGKKEKHLYIIYIYVYI